MSGKVDFRSEVVNESQEIPVVVDFWAPWCGPCQYLTPILDELHNNAKGAWHLVKINTEENPELVSEFKIYSIPTVKLFFKGKQLSQFSGALPGFQIKKWLNDYLPDPRKEELGYILKNNKGEELIAALNDFVERNPDIEDGQLVLAKQIIFDQPERALSLISNVSVLSKFYDAVEDLKNIAALLMFSGNSDDSLNDLLSKASNFLKNKNFEHALQLLIEAVLVDKHYSDDLPRKAAISVFHYLGDKHPLTLKYRKKFDMALY
ncbi:MAG: tetratricopeptide repeat protein [Cytophagaceae bacterium]